jgi:hypothetical protein
VKDDAKLGRLIRRDVDKPSCDFRFLGEYRYFVKAVRKRKQVWNQERLRGNGMNDAVIGDVPVAQADLGVLVQRRAVVGDEREA